MDKEQKERSNVLEPVLGLALYGLLGPVFNAAVVGMLYKLGYELRFGGLIVWFFSALYLLAGVLLLVFFAFYQRKPHTPLAMKTIYAWVLLAIVASSAGINVWWVRDGIFCKTGECPRFDYRADGAAQPLVAPRALPESAPAHA